MLILFVDDDHGLLDQARYVLEDKWPDFEVITVDSGDDALDVLSKKKVDVVISDYMMSPMDGLELLERVRDRYGDMPFILFTGKGREEVAMEALNMGADRYLRKGGDPTTQYEMLAQAIQQEVDHRKEREHKSNMLSRLEHMEGRYRSMFDNLDVPMVCIDEDMNLSMVNKSFERLSSYDKGSVEDKKRWLHFVSDDDKKQVEKYHKLRGIETSLAPSIYTFYFVDKYNKETFMCATFQSIPNGSTCLVSLLDFDSFDSMLKELKKIEETMIGLSSGDPPESVPSFVKEIFKKENLNKVIREWMLDEVLLMLILLNNGANGKELMSELNTYFGMELSSSIVYPALHRLEEGGILSVREGIKTKEYSIKDESLVRKRLNLKIKELFGCYALLKLLNPY